jgi:hypothetical protein
VTWLISLERWGSTKSSSTGRSSEKILNVLGLVRIDTEVFELRCEFRKVGVVVVVIAVTMAVVVPSQSCVDVVGHGTRVPVVISTVSPVLLLHQLSDREATRVEIL